MKHNEAYISLKFKLQDQFCITAEQLSSPGSIRLKKGKTANTLLKISLNESLRRKKNANFTRALSHRMICLTVVTYRCKRHCDTKKKRKRKHSLLTLTIDWIPQITSSIISHNVTRISILLSKWQLWNVSYNFMLRTRHENWQLLSHFYCLVTVYCLKSWNFFFKSKKNYVKYVRVFITRLSNTE